MLLEGDQLDYVIKNATITNTKLFLIFYIPSCIYCKHALKVLNDNIKNTFDEKAPISFGIINLENQTNIWTGLRFNITRIPYIILIEKNKMYYYQNSFEEQSVMNFINEEKNIEDALDIPPPVGFLGKLNAAMKELNEKVETYFGKYGINFTNVLYMTNVSQTYKFFQMLILICLKMLLFLLAFGQKQRKYQMFIVYFTIITEVTILHLR